MGLAPVHDLSRAPVIQGGRSAETGAYTSYMRIPATSRHRLTGAQKESWTGSYGAALIQPDAQAVRRRVCGRYFERARAFALWLDCAPWKRGRAPVLCIPQRAPALDRAWTALRFGRAVLPPTNDDLLYCHRELRFPTKRKHPSKSSFYLT